MLSPSAVEEEENETQSCFDSSNLLFLAGFSEEAERFLLDEVATVGDGSFAATAFFSFVISSPCCRSVA